MRKHFVMIMAFVVALLAVGMPILAALYIAHRQSMDEESSRAQLMAAGLLRRMDTMGAQARSAYEQLHRADLANPCSAAGLALMRRIDIDSSYLQAVGYVSGDRLLCSSFGNHGDGIALGPVAYTSTFDAKVRPAVDMGMGADHRFLVFEKGGFATAIHPDALLDIDSDVPGLAMGIYGHSSRQPLAHRGTFQPVWMTKLGGARQRTFFDGRHLVAIERSQTYDVATYVAVPIAHLRRRLRSFTRILVPLGLMLGLGICAAIFLLARQQASTPATLRAALKRREFELRYQPIVALADGRMVGAEALMRWPQPGGPPMRPSLFIPAAEDCGLIQQFTAYALSQVALDAPAYIAQHPDCYISINLASPDLHSETTVEALRQLASTPGIPAGNIMVEVTEHSFLDAERASRTVTAIRQLGIRVAIDDFGTGFSSLKHLTGLKTDYLKIDKAFVETVGTDAATSEVALHIIRVAQSLQMTLIAEGIETRAQADFLRGNGVEFGQGWLFGRAVPMSQLLSERRTA